MSCEACREALEIDGIEPDCFEKECIVPPLDRRGQRIIELRSRIITLQGLVDSQAVLKIYGATIEDIEMLAFLEEKLKKMQNSEGENG